LRITLVTATANDTVESLAARMATPDHPLARFLLLNGLTKPALTVGETYKIVSE
jgi:predicted Zn-dependent protease